MAVKKRHERAQEIIDAYRRTHGDQVIEAGWFGEEKKVSELTQWEIETIVLVVLFDTAAKLRQTLETMQVPNRKARRAK